MYIIGYNKTIQYNTYLRTVPTNSKVFLDRFMIMQEMYVQR